MITIQKTITLSLLTVATMFVPGPHLFAQDATELQESMQLENPDEKIGTLILADMGTNEILDLLENYYNKPILRHPTLPPVKISFRSKGALTKREAVMTLESLLTLNGVAVSYVNSETLKAIPANLAVQQVPPLIEGSSLEMPTDMKIYAKYFPLDFMSAGEAVSVITPLLSQGAPVIALERANAILVTDTLANIQRVERLMKNFDAPPSVNFEVEFFQLRNVSATDVVNRLKNMQTGSLRRFLDQNTTFDADERSNQLIVFTHPSNMKLIRQTVEKLDVNIAPMTETEVYYLKHANAEEVVEIIQSVLTGQQQAREQLERNSRSRSASNARQAQQQQQQNNQLPQIPTAQSTIEAGMKSLQFSDFFTIVADPRANAIVTSGMPNDQRYFEELLEKIDIVLPQVRIEVVIADVTLSKGQARGIDSFGFNYVNNDFGFEINQGSSLPIQVDVNTFKNLDMSAVITAAKQNSNVRILSSPVIVTTHNKEAFISVGEQRPIVTSTSSGVDSDSAIRSNVELRPIELRLQVTPLIGNNGVIQLQINQKVEDVGDTVLIAGAGEQPIIISREAESYVSVGDNEMVILGGLQQNSTRYNDNRLPILGDLPLVGKFFGRQSKDDTRNELIIFIKPHIINDTAQANESTLKELPKYSSEQELRRYIDDGIIPSRIDENDPMLNPDASKRITTPVSTENSAPNGPRNRRGGSLR